MSGSTKVCHVIDCQLLCYIHCLPFQLNNIFLIRVTNNYTKVLLLPTAVPDSATPSQIVVQPSEAQEMLQTFWQKQLNEAQSVTAVSIQFV